MIFRLGRRRKREPSCTLSAASRTPPPERCWIRCLRIPSLAAWKRTLDLARDRQRTESRDAGYVHAPPGRVAETLRGGLPTNPADLLALVADHLDDFAAEIRGGDGNAWRGFWNEDSYGRPDEPKLENSCRDAVLGALRARLDDRIAVQAEVRHAGNTRADLRVSYDGLAIPIEIKREGHPGLWNAVSDQLVPKYTTLPAAGGHGIYLVLWFGGQRVGRGPGGQPPTTPEALKQALVAGLPRDSRTKTEARVLDLTPPCRDWTSLVPNAHGPRDSSDRS